MLCEQGSLTDGEPFKSGRVDDQVPGVPAGIAANGRGSQSLFLYGIPNQDRQEICD